MEAALFRIYGKFEDVFGKEKARGLVEDLVFLVEQRSETLSTREDVAAARDEMKANNRETELRLTREIEGIKKEVKDLEMRLSREIKDLEVRLVREINRAKIWMITSVGLIIAAIKALDYVLK